MVLDLCPVLAATGLLAFCLMFVLDALPPFGYRSEWGYGFKLLGIIEWVGEGLLLFSRRSLAMLAVLGVFGVLNSSRRVRQRYGVALATVAIAHASVLSVAWAILQVTLALL